MLVLSITLAIFLIVAGLLLYALIRYRHRPEDALREPAQVYGSNQIELSWTVIPVLIVVMLFLTTARVIIGTQAIPKPEDALTVTVIGHQFWWEYRYPKLGIVTANELHIPVSSSADSNPTYLNMSSADVAHSFWMPRLAGKTDLIPNRVNHTWIDPSTPGIFWGNCTEFCGAQHANMLIQVVVQEPADFDKWVAEQQQAQAIPAEISTGQKRFQISGCWACHAVKGTRFNGKVGPDLTHLMSRRQLGSGVLDNTPANLKDWIVNPQQSKPGCLMPASKMTGQNLDDLVAYLETLK